MEKTDEDNHYKTSNQSTIKDSSSTQSHTRKGKPSSSSSSSDLSHLSSPTHVSSPEKDNPPPKPSSPSPAESSDLSHRSSLSHGSSPREHKRPASPPVINRLVREDTPAVTKVDPGGARGEVNGDGGRRVRQSLSILRRAKRETTVKKVALGFRVCGLVFCVISLSIMAADKDKGWALDSFYRYKEFRYSMSVNLIGFVYSALQTYDLTFHLCTGNYVLRHQLRFYFHFAMDQILTYLLMSASSSAATRVEDWQSNWGKDKFPEMASVSVAMSFMAFVAFAGSTLISGYALCTYGSM